MAGYSKDVIVAVLEGKLREAKQEADARFAKELEQFKVRRAAIQRAKKNVRQAVRDLQDGRIDVEEFAKRCNAGRSYDHWFIDAAKTVGVAPKRASSARELAFDRVIRLIKSNTADSLTIADLRALGVLGYVSFDK